MSDTKLKALVLRLLTDWLGAALQVHCAYRHVGCYTEARDCEPPVEPVTSLRMCMRAPADIELRDCEDLFGGCV